MARGRDDDRYLPRSASRQDRHRPFGHREVNHAIGLGGIGQTRPDRDADAADSRQFTHVAAVRGAAWRVDRGHDLQLGIVLGESDESLTHPPARAVDRNVGFHWCLMIEGPLPSSIPDQGP